LNKHISIKVTGRVQGVFFRVFTRNVAQELGANGFVRNENDGSVYIEAEGNEEVLQKFLQRMKKGPANAVVEELKIQKGELKSFKDFKIER
jgi:acylphosphatase